MEAQEKKITALELNKKMGGGGGGATEMLRELERARAKESEARKLNSRLEEDVLKLRLQAESAGLRIRECSEVLGGIKNLDELPDVQRVLELLKKAFNGDGPVSVAAREPPPPTATAKSRPKGSLKEVKVLLDEVRSLKQMNADLIAKLEAKDKELEAAAWKASARSKAEPGTTQAKTEVVPAATDADPAPPRSYTGEQVGNSTMM